MPRRKVILEMICRDTIETLAYILGEQSAAHKVLVESRRHKDPHFFRVGRSLFCVDRTEILHTDPVDEPV